MTSTTRIHLTADQADVVARKLRRPNVLGAALQVGRHGYVELDLQARTIAGEPYGATWEISPAGTWTLNAGKDPLGTSTGRARPNSSNADDPNSPAARRARGLEPIRPAARRTGDSSAMAASAGDDGDAHNTR